MIFAIFFLCEPPAPRQSNLRRVHPPRHRRDACSIVPYTGFRIWVSLVVTKLYSLLMKIGEHRAKEVDDHHNYDAKCACMP